MIKSPSAEDAFEKVRHLERVEEAHALGLYPYFKAIQEHRGGAVLVDGEEFILTGSNDYLGLTRDHRLVEAAQAALETYGTSCTGSRFLTGTLTIHEQLEEALAEFLGREQALVFSAGFLACASSVSALAGRNDIVYFDRENHASLYDGAKLSYATLRRFHHRDAADLARALEADADKGGGRLVYTDGVFSMSGHIASLPELIEVCRRYGARLVVDEAHSSGVLGAGGRGTAEHFGLTGEVDLVAGTFSKSFASVGGFVAGPREVVEFIKHTARPFIFNAALPASNAAAALKALEIMRDEPEHRETLWRNVNFMRESLLSMGFDLLGSETPIIPVRTGDDHTAIRFWKGLWDERVFTTPSVPPAVPVGMSLIRTSYNSAHSQEQLERVLEAFERVGKALGVIG